MSKKDYVVHHCKNKKCNKAWTDLDLTNAQKRPPVWKYCKDCCERMGINFDSQEPPKKKLFKKQIKTLQENQFSTRKKKD